MAVWMHGRNIVYIERVGLRHAHCMRCKRPADVCDEENHEFALCEGCLLVWDIKQSGLAEEWPIAIAKRNWLLWYNPCPFTTAEDRRHWRKEKKQAERYLQELTKALAEAESKRWHAHGAVS